MNTLPAVVPEGEYPRSEIVSVRIARKVAPLFGVVWAQNPFDRTWVCDFSTLTLTEVARGAPLPERSASLESPEDGEAPAPGAGSGHEDDAQGWMWNGRGVVVPGGAAPLGSLANATLNRFGPHTKAAVVLAGANRLLRDSTQAVGAVCASINQTSASPRLRLAIWAGLTLEVFRGQPALVIAALQARAVQRSLTVRWGNQVGLGNLGATAARSEIGASGVTGQDSAWQPQCLALIDDTLQQLNLAGLAGIGPERGEDIAAAWCRRLLQMGRPGSGMVWVVEDEKGHRTAHSYQRVGAMVAPFVAEALGQGDISGQVELQDAQSLDEWPSPPAGLPDHRARAHLVAVHVAVNYLRYVSDSGSKAPQLRERTRSFVALIAKEYWSGPHKHDPAVVLVSCYSAYLRLWDNVRSRERPAAEMQAAMTEVLQAQQSAWHAYEAGNIDPGAASYLLEIATVALAKIHDPASSKPPGLDRALARGWRQALSARSMPPMPGSHLDSLNGAQIFHLANYAAYLADRGPIADLRHALRIFEAVIEVREAVAQNEPASLPAKHAAARDAHQAAASIAARMAEACPAREQAARARAWDSAVAHAVAVLAAPITLEQIANGDADRAVVWTAEQIEPALSHLIVNSPQALPEPLRETAINLVKRARENSNAILTVESRERLTVLGDRLTARRNVRAPA
ncbi:hypothetical protein [Kineosporia sp. NBRC 101731]|uniref:hypothetical protein n=1 Tax=Kineosporia sp. NBRC 101731 TaxID=3032199 RepID=UPI0024A203C2|nr:hypothetical protein [Kineosporia sp. NBRC 101731]GLY33471.1 hypothetical protein Kisp02_68360 [Kineosporia sp. NBRC 101731]